MVVYIFFRSFFSSKFSEKILQRPKKKFGKICLQLMIANVRRPTVSRQALFHDGAKVMMNCEVVLIKLNYQ